MKIYNTLNKKVEEFVPNNSAEVKIYTCGPTVYHYAHIGNLRTYIFEDVLVKSLKYIGYNVKRVMNITDVGHMTSDADTGEDKMLKGAQRENKTVYEIADYYTQAFLKDMKELNNDIPVILEKASDHIKEYIKIIETLLENGAAYIAGGNVYFDITKQEDYYKLSGHNPLDNIVGVRDDVTEDKCKKNPADFGLWFTSSKFNDQDMKWDSPWGIGYPGWHIECSGIAMKYFSDQLDIHCGGIDNIFPHHSNEIAQSECYLGHKWCNYWMHGEHLNDETGKMSKSKGEFLTLQLLINKGYNPLVYRLFCLQSHYRNQLLFSYERLNEVSNVYEKLTRKIKQIKEEGKVLEDKVSYYNQIFKSSLENDLNTSSCLTCLYDVLKDEELNGATKLYLINIFDSVLSLNLLKEENIQLTKEQLALIDKRNEAKQNKDYNTADKLREELEKSGIILKDTKDGTTYELRR